MRNKALPWLGVVLATLGIVCGSVLPTASAAPLPADVDKVSVDSPICDDGTTRCFTVPQMVHNIAVNHPHPWSDLHLGQPGFRLQPDVIHRIARTHYRWCGHHPAHCTQPKYHESWSQQVEDCGVFGCWWPDFRQIVQCAQGSMVNLGCSIDKAVFGTVRRVVGSTPFKVTVICGGMFVATTFGAPEITGGMVLGAGGRCGVSWFASYVWPF